MTGRRAAGGTQPRARSPSASRPRPFEDGLAVLPGRGNGSARGNGNGNGGGPAAGLPTIDGRVVDPTQISAEVERLNAGETIAWAADAFGSRLRFAVSFQKTSSVIIDLARRLEGDAHFFYLDTDLLFQESYATRDALAERYAIDFVRHAGISLGEQERLHGANLWRRHPDACCGVRKVEPMRGALEGARCWVSGIRRVDSATRAEAAKFGWDKRFGLWKLNPLADWTDEQVWNHIRENDVPYNPLHDQGYPSIGCTHCTVKPAAGDAPRAGRWAGIDRTECGLNG